MTRVSINTYDIIVEKFNIVGFNERENLSLDFVYLHLHIQMYSI